MFRLYSLSHLQAVTHKIFYIQMTMSQKIRDLLSMVPLSIVYKNLFRTACRWLYEKSRNKSLL